MSHSFYDESQWPSFYLTEVERMRAALGISSITPVGQSRLPAISAAAGACGDPLGLASEMLSQVQTARSQFVEDGDRLVQQCLIALSAGAGCIAGLAWMATSWKDSPPVYSAVLAGAGVAISLLPAVVSNTLKIRLEASYDFYAESVINAAITWDSLRMPHSHAWIRYIHEYMDHNCWFYTSAPNAKRLFGMFKGIPPVEDYLKASESRVADSGSKITSIYTRWKCGFQEVCDLQLRQVCLNRENRPCKPQTIRQLRAVWKGAQESLLSHFKWLIFWLFLCGLVLAVGNGYFLYQFLF